MKVKLEKEKLRELEEKVILQLCPNWIGHRRTRHMNPFS